MESQKILKQLKNGLIVSCQALENEPLHGSVMMSKMAYAAMLGGAKGIRANCPEDILEIKKIVSLPVIGIIKKDFPDSAVYITPTMQEIDKLVKCGAEIIAMDATQNLRPNGEGITTFFPKVRQKYANQLFMADCATLEEGIQAAALGFDLVATTLSGYTEQTKQVSLPNFQMMRALVQQVTVPVIAEGGIWTPEQLQMALDTGVWAAVVGTAITRPQEITRRFVQKIEN